MKSTLAFGTRVVWAVDFRGDGRRCKLCTLQRVGGVFLTSEDGMRNEYICPVCRIRNPKLTYEGLMIKVGAIRKNRKNGNTQKQDGR